MHDTYLQTALIKLREAHGLQTNMHYVITIVDWTFNFKQLINLVWTIYMYIYI